jgi:hypothetical protein
MRSAYEECVPQIFRSQAIDVSVQLADANTRRLLHEDLQPVLQELEQQNIIT